MKHVLIALALLVAAPAGAVTLKWTNPAWETFDDIIPIGLVPETRLDSAYVYSARWDACAPQCGGETIIARLPIRGREGQIERLVIARPPGVYGYRVRAQDRAGNRGWWSNQVSWDERPGGLAASARARLVREMWTEPVEVRPR